MIEESLFDEKNLAEVHSPDFPGERLIITDSSFSFARREEKIAAEAALDGINIVPTSSKEEGLAATTIVERYKSLMHSFQSLLADLATIARNTIVPAIAGAPGWTQDTEPTPQQTKILHLLDSLPAR